ncbi:MAG: hypothetical protein WDO72_14565 [Pseudomonadota bacterium]
MKSSNLALRAGPAEDQPAPPFERTEIDRAAAPAVSRVRPRPRRPLAFRTIVIRDQGLPLFRCN